jgi:RimJ/RimL family protein N-acetyltransferase
MKLWLQLFQTARNGLRRWWAQPTRPLTLQAADSEVLIPIVSLDERHRPRILTHLLELDRDDRMLRFGYPATDEQIARYVKGMDFKRDHIYAIFNSALRIIALAHLSIERPEQGQARAEFGVSVRKASRGMGFGNRLFERAMVHARHEKVSIFYIHALSENIPMLAIAKRHGATLERDGSETEAHLRLPATNIENDLQDWVSDQYGRMDYSVKQEVKHLVDAVAQVQEIRRAVRAGRHKSAS